MSNINYSKWDHIEVSDDEDDTHPNIDTASLFRWRHQARVQRMEEMAKEKEELEKELKRHNAKLDSAKSKEVDEKTLQELRLEAERLEKCRAELFKKEKSQPLNIDTICKEGKTRTIINKAAAEKPKPRSDDETWKNLEEFKEKYDDQIKKYAMFSRLDDAQKFLEDNPHLVCEAACDRLVLWCIDLAVEEKWSLLEYVTKQCISLQFLLKLGAELGTDPRNCLRQFYAKLRDPQPEYMRAFNEELDAFRSRVKSRAQARIEEAMKEYEEEQKKARLGPGGLDPVEVFESLPPEMQQCFEAKDIPMLQKVMSQMPEEQARYHLQRCIDSGMWVPDANKGEDAGAEDQQEADGDAAAGAAAAASGAGEGENVYEAA